MNMEETATLKNGKVIPRIDFGTWRIPNNKGTVEIVKMVIPEELTSRQTLTGTNVNSC